MEQRAVHRQKKILDVLCVGAYDGNTLIGLAGASADCDTMWQIGVDVLPEYRRKGVAGALTSRLALEIIKTRQSPVLLLCMVKYQICWERNKSGFRPAWAELTVKPADFVDKLNGIKI